jgi:hypothetical protein
LYAPYGYREARFNENQGVGAMGYFDSYVHGQQTPSFPVRYQSQRRAFPEHFVTNFPAHSLHNNGLGRRKSTHSIVPVEKENGMQVRMAPAMPDRRDGWGGLSS